MLVQFAELAVKVDRESLPVQYSNERLSVDCQLPRVYCDAYCCDDVRSKQKSSALPTSCRKQITYPLRMFNHFGAYAVRSIADATELRMMLTQTWAYAHAAEAKKLDIMSCVPQYVGRSITHTPALDAVELSWYLWISRRSRYGCQ